MKIDDDSLTLDPYNKSFTYILILVSYCLKVLFTWYLISIDEHMMNKPKRTATLDLFIIKKVQHL